MQPPKKTSAGYILTASWLNRLLDALKSNKVRGDGKTIRVSTTPAGTVVSVIKKPGGSAASGGTTTVPIKITSKTDYNTYTADIYADGRDQDATETAAIVRVLDIAETETIPDSTYLMASPLPWPDLDDTSKRKKYYTIDPSRSY